MSAVDIAVQILEIDEGFSDTPYYDTKGIPTYGHGFVCGKKNEMLPKISITLNESLKRPESLFADDFGAPNGLPNILNKKTGFLSYYNNAVEASTVVTEHFDYGRMHIRDNGFVENNMYIEANNDAWIAVASSRGVINGLFQFNPLI